MSSAYLREQTLQMRPIYAEWVQARTTRHTLARGPEELRQVTFSSTTMFRIGSETSASYEQPAAKCNAQQGERLN